MESGDSALVNILLIIVALVVIAGASMNSSGCNNDNVRMISRTERVTHSATFFGLGPKHYQLQLMACEPYDGCNWETYFSTPDYADIEMMLQENKQKEIK